jgi:hypothetical protein
MPLSASRGSRLVFRLGEFILRVRTYTGYSVSCAGVWALILAAGKRWSDAEDWDRLRVTCAGWWMGWTSATIARVAYPAPKQLDPAAEKRIANASLALVALGLASVARVLAASKRPQRR